MNTAPEKTIAAVADHGVITGNTMQGTYAQAAAVFSGLKEVGVDLDDVFTVLETEGVDKFIASWNELLDSVATELANTSTLIHPGIHRAGTTADDVSGATNSPGFADLIRDGCAAWPTRVDPDLIQFSLIDFHLINDLPRVPRIGTPSSRLPPPSTTCMGATMTATAAPALTDQPIEQVTVPDSRLEARLRGLQLTVFQELSRSVG